MQDLAERGQRRSATAPAEPILYEASIAADEAAAERIAHALEETCDPSPVAVGMFELAKGRFEVFAHFAEAPPRETLLDLIGHVANGAQFGPLLVERVPNEDWVTLSQNKRGPIKAGRFLVHGRHDRARVPHRLSTIEIDAGQAFGTAHHASTRGCLIALDDVLKRFRPRSVLDIGTGTGILGIAAAKVLRQPILASDNDPLALTIARDNARKNSVAPPAACGEGDRLRKRGAQTNNSGSRAGKFARALLVRACAHACGAHPLSRASDSLWPHHRPSARHRGTLHRAWLHPPKAHHSRRGGRPW